MPENVKCPKCGTEIGELVEIDGVTLLHIGGLITRFAHGTCACCGEEFHWSIADLALARLLAHFGQCRKNVL